MAANAWQEPDHMNGRRLRCLLADDPLDNILPFVWQSPAHILLSSGCCIFPVCMMIMTTFMRSSKRKVQSIQKVRTVARCQCQNSQDRRLSHDALVGKSFRSIFLTNGETKPAIDLEPSPNTLPSSFYGLGFLLQEIEHLDICQYKGRILLTIFHFTLF